MAYFPVMAGFECAYFTTGYPELSPAALSELQRRHAFEQPRDPDAALVPCLCKHCDKVVLPEMKMKLCDSAAAGPAAWARSMLCLGAPKEDETLNRTCSFICPECNHKLFKARRISRDDPWVKIYY